MDKKLKFKNLYNAFNSQIEYLKFLNELDYSVDLNKIDLDQMEAIQTGLYFTVAIDHYFERKKDKIVGCSLNDDYLKELANMISVDNGKGYTLGELSYKDALTVLSKVRNKFAHGDYVVEDGNIIFFENDKKGIVKLDDLRNMICFFSLSQKNNKKNGEYVKTYFFPPKGKKGISSINDLKSFGNRTRVLTIKEKPAEGYERNKKYLEKIHNLFSQIDRAHDLYYSSKDIQGMLVAKKNKLHYDEIEVSVTEKKLIDKNYYEYLEKDFNNNKKQYYEQNIVPSLNIRRLISLSYRYENADNIYFIFEKAIQANIAIINKIREKNNTTMYDLSYVLNDFSNYFYHQRNNTLLTSYLFAFNSFFQYGYEDGLTNNGSDSILKIVNKETLDLSKLDLDILDDKNHNDKKKCAFLFDEENERIEKTKKIKNDLDELEDLKNKLVLNGHEKEKENRLPKLEDKINQKHEELNIELNNLLKVSNAKINKNKYIKNASIIGHVRNALAHGNIMIEKESYYKDVDNMDIVIQDYDENGVLVYDKHIRFNKFKQIFNDNNLEIIKEFYEQNLDIENEKGKILVK